MCNLSFRLLNNDIPLYSSVIHMCFSSLTKINTFIRNANRMERKLKKIAGQQLQLLRLEKNLTQEQMSEKLNLSTSAYCKIEYGETDLTLTRLDKIAKVLGISALALFSHISKNMHSYSDNNNENGNAVPNYDDLRELIKANSRIIDLLCKRIDLLEQHL